MRGCMGVVAGFMIWFGVPGVLMTGIGLFVKPAYYDGRWLVIFLVLLLAGVFLARWTSGNRGARRSPENTVYPDDWSDMRQAVLQRDGYRCGNCGSTINLQIHHIVPLSRGGTNLESNLRTLCESCHQKIHPHMR
jgi:hypothetical protein